MDVTSIITALLTTTALAGLTLVGRSLVPSVRWARQLERDLVILGGLDDGPERELWSASVDRQAERLRRYREETPWWDKVIPVLAFVGVVVSVVTFGFNDLGRDVFVKDAAVMIPLSIVAVLGALYFVILFVRGRDLSEAVRSREGQGARDVSGDLHSGVSERDVVHGCSKGDGPHDGSSYPPTRSRDSSRDDGALRGRG